MRRQIIARLHGTSPARDPEGMARSALPPGADALFAGPLTPAAVLVPLVERSGGDAVVLTRRADHLTDHPGQISLPGGRVDPQDAGPLAAALREFREELGAQPPHVDVAGFLPPQAVVTGFIVTPVVGFISAEASFQPDPVEVAEVFEVPLAFLLDPAQALAGTREFRGVRLPMVEFHFGERRIWGATAQILLSLVKTIT